jgi:hypothetical protein
MAQDKVSEAQDFKELQTYVNSATNFTGVPAADKYLPYSSSWKTVHSIVLQDGIDSRKLRNMPWRKFDRMYPAPEAVAAYIPLVYADWNQQLVFMPVPDAVYPLVVRVTTYPTPFTLTTPLTNTSDYTGKDECLVAFASGYLWRSFGRYDKAQEWDSVGQNLLQIAMRADADRPDLDTSGTADDNGPLSGAYWANPWITSVGGE